MKKISIHIALLLLTGFTAMAGTPKKAAADNVAKNLEQLDLLTFDHFKEVRTICTPAQQKKFDEIIEEVLQMIASGPLRGRPGMNNGERMPPPGDHMPPPEH